MWARSQAFADALTDGYALAFKCDVLYGGSIISNTLKIIGGNVQVDYTASILRRLSMTVVDADGSLAPRSATDMLSPYGHEIRPYRGMRFPNGTYEYIPCGTFRIAQSDDERGQIQITGFDRSRSVSRARFEAPYVVAAGTNYGVAIAALISSRLPRLAFNFVSTSATTPLLVFDQAADPWQCAQTMADSIGCDLYFDPMGVCTMRQTPNPATAPVVASWVAGSTSLLLTAKSSLTDDPGWNGVVVDGEPPGGTPVHVVVYDTDPSSPTYAAGPYNKVPEFMRSPLIATTAQATAAGQAELLRNRGGTEQVNATVMVDPTLEAVDLVYIKHNLERIDANYVVEAFTVPFDAKGTMPVKLRKRRSL